MSLSFTFCTFGCVESTMNGDDKGGRRTARRQVSKVHVAKPTGSGKKVLTIGGGLDRDNIVSTDRRGNARNARGKVASASSTGKRRTVLEAASAAAAGINVTKKQKASSPVLEAASAAAGGTNVTKKQKASSPVLEAASAAAAGTNVTKKQKASSPVVRPSKATKFLLAVRNGMKTGKFYTLQELANGLGIPPFQSDTKVGLQKLLLFHSQAVTQKDPHALGEALDALGEALDEHLGDALDEHLALSGENIDVSSPVQESSSLPDLDHPYTTHSGMDASKAQVLNDYAGHFNAGHMIHVLCSDFQEECVTTVEETTGWRKSMLLQQHITRQVHSRGLTLAITLRPPPSPLPLLSFGTLLSEFTPGSELFPFSLDVFVIIRVCFRVHTRFGTLAIFR